MNKRYDMAGIAYQVGVNGGFIDLWSIILKGHDTRWVVYDSITFMGSDK